MARLERVVFQCDQATIADVIAFGNEEIRVDSKSVAFIRSGFFARPLKGAPSIVDANYAVFGGDADCLLSDACKHICACTIVRYAEAAGRPLACSACSLVSARAFLLQAQVVRDAHVSAANPEPVICSLLREMRSSPLAPHTHSRIVTEIRRLLNESPSRHLPLASIAREFYMSPFTVSRLFHRETGMRMRDYSSRLRLRKALNLLMSSRKSLTSIAIDLGFYDESHFSKAFRAEFGLSPHSVRKY